MDGSVYLSLLHHILCFPAQGGGLVGGQVAELGCHGLHPQQLRGPCGLHPGRRVSRGGKRDGDKPQLHLPQARVSL